MSHYRRHVFFCTNVRAADDERGDCTRLGAANALDYAKQRAKELGLPEQGIRVNQAGCLHRCEEGPVCVVYPEAVWYRYVDRQDIEEIVSEHLQHGRTVTRLLVDAAEAP